MESILNVTTIIITYLIPVIQTVLQLWEFFLNKNNDNQYINNGTIVNNFSTINTKEFVKQNNITQQNIEYIRKSLFKSYPLITVSFIIFNMINNWIQLPLDSVLKGNFSKIDLINSGIKDIVVPIFDLISKSLMDSILPVLSLIMSFLIVLTLKKILEFKLINFPIILYYSLTSFYYFRLYNSLQNFSITNISTNITILNSSIDYAPFVILALFMLMIYFIIINQKLINLTFETNKINLKLLKHLIPRLIFYITLIITPLFLLSIITYYKQ